MTALGVVLLSMQAVIADSATADPADTAPIMSARSEQQAEPTLTPKGAALRAQELHQGSRVLKVEKTDGGYRVKLLKDGDIRIVFIPQH